MPSERDTVKGIDDCPSPSAVVRHLDQYVIGQDAAKRTLAVAVYGDLSSRPFADVDVVVDPRTRTRACERLAKV